MAREKPGPSVLNPVMEPSFWKTSVLTDPVARDRASVSSQSAPGSLLVGNGHVGADEPLVPDQAHHVREFLRRRLDAYVARLDARGIQRGLLHGRRFGMVDGVADDGQSGGNGFVGIERVFFIQKIGQGVIGFHGKIEERKLAFRIYYGGNPADFKANAYMFFPNG